MIASHGLVWVAVQESCPMALSHWLTRNEYHTRSVSSLFAQESVAIFRSGERTERRRFVRLFRGSNAKKTNQARPAYFPPRRSSLFSMCFHMRRTPGARKTNKRFPRRPLAPCYRHPRVTKPALRKLCVMTSETHPRCSSTARGIIRGR